jgi:hypothetical protein
MSSPNRVVELVFRLRDNVTKPLREIQGRVKQALNFGLAVGGIATLGAVFSKVISATREAEEALVSFNLAYKNLGSTVGRTRESMLKFADDASKTTIFDDESIIRAQATLLKFKSVSGDTFDRARQAALDFASVMKTDIESAANIVGRALERPSIAIRQLRQVGVIFTADQEKMIKSLEQTGQRALAAQIVLSELEKKIKGGATTAANTFSGALARTKTAFDNLFETDPRPLTEGFNSLANTLNDESVRRGLQELIKGMAELVGWLVKAVALLGQFGKAVANVIVSPNVPSATQNLRRELAERQIELRESPALGGPDSRARKELEAYVETLRQRVELSEKLDKMRADGGGDSLPSKAPGRRGGDRGILDFSRLDKDANDIEEVIVNATEKTSSAIDELYDNWRKQSLAQADLEGQQFRERIATLDALKAAGQISGDAYARAYNEAVEEGLEEVQVTAKAVLVKPINQLEQAFSRVATSISESLADAISTGGYHGMTTLREILKQTLRNIVADIIRSGIKELLISLFKSIAAAVKSSSAFSSGAGFGGFFGSLLGGVSKFFGFAGGGRGKGWQMVGEEGPELVNLGGGSNVYNARTVRAMGLGGGNVTYAPQFNLNIQGSADDRSIGEAMMVMRQELARQQRVIVRLMERGR